MFVPTTLSIALAMGCAMRFTRSPSPVGSVGFAGLMDSDIGSALSAFDLSRALLSSASFNFTGSERRLFRLSF